MSIDYGSESDRIRLWASEDEEDTDTHIHHNGSEQGAQTGIGGGNDEQGLGESWEAIEMHPFRRNPVVHTRTRLGSHRDLQEMQDLVSAHVAMGQHRGANGLGEESRRQAMTRLANRLSDNVEARIRRYAEMEWRLQRVGLF